MLLSTTHKHETQKLLVSIQMENSMFSKVFLFFLQVPLLVFDSFLGWFSGLMFQNLNPPARRLFLFPLILEDLSIRIPKGKPSFPIGVRGNMDKI